MAVSATAILIGTAIAGAIGGSVGTVMVQDEWVSSPNQATAPHYQSTAPQGAPYNDPNFRKYYYDREGNIHYGQ